MCVYSCVNKLNAYTGYDGRVLQVEGAFKGCGCFAFGLHEESLKIAQFAQTCCLAERHMKISVEVYMPYDLIDFNECRSDH